MSAKINPRNGSELKAVKFGDTEVDVDESTGGMWLDASELSELTDWFHDGDPYSSFAAQHSGEVQHDTVKGACPHPECQTETMDEHPVPLSDGSHLTLDICSTCKGIWVDGPELAPLREAMMKNKAAGFQSKVLVESSRPLIQRMIYPSFVKNMVERK